ncbi:MAG: hypothetical protein ACRC92_20680 [Peptostreptococcaceae bacterium]
MDFDGDSVSIKPVITKEGVEDHRKIVSNLLHVFDYAGNFRREVGKDGVQTIYTFTKEPTPADKSKKIDSNHDFIKYILNPKEELDLQVLYAYTAAFSSKVKPELSIHDTVDVTINKKKYSTTVGRLVVFKAIFKPVMENPNFDFSLLNTTVYGNTLQDVFKNVMWMQIEKKTEGKVMNTVVSRYNEFCLRAATVYNATCTYEMLNPDQEFIDFRNKTIDPIADEVKESGDIEKLEGKEAEVIEFAKKKFAKDDMYELYQSKNKASWTNDFKAMHIDMGALPSITGGKASIVTRPLTDGMSIEDEPDLVNTGAMGAYMRGNQTALAGALYKLITSSFTNVTGTRGDCGNTKTIEVEVSSKYDILGKYMVNSKGESIRITLENVDKYVGKTVNIRDPFFCKSTGDSYCSHCVGELPFEILGRDKIPIGILTAEAATGLLNMFMKATHDLKQSVFTIDDFNKYVMPKCDLFEIKKDPIDGIEKVYTKKDLVWRVPALSVEPVGSEYAVMAHGSIVESDGKQFTLVLGTEVTTTPTDIISASSTENEIYKHFQFIFKAGVPFLNNITFYRKEHNVYKMLNLFLNGNVSNLIPVKYHLDTLLNTFKTNKKVNASLLTLNIILSTLARDGEDINKPVRETGGDSYNMVSTLDLVPILGGTFEALFSGDVNRGLFISMSGTDKEQRKSKSPIEKAFYY